jgi:L-ribulose-5-phosphate 3-epimerase UlaE
MDSRDRNERVESMDLLSRAIDFTVETGIRVIQLAGDDAYYEQSTEGDTKNKFLENLILAPR